MTAITVGTKIIYKPTGKILTIASVTEERASWFVDAHKGGSGVNTLRKVGTTKKALNDAEYYKII